MKIIMAIHSSQLMTDDIHHFGPIVQVEKVDVAGVQEPPELVVIDQPEENLVHKLESQTSSQNTVISHEEINH